jgi:Flp pilus assembly pilin Flp
MYFAARSLQALWDDESGQDLVEYSLLVTLIALATMAAVQTCAEAITILFENSATNVSQS